MKKTLSLVITFLILSTSLTGCYDKREVDDQTYVIALGVDKGTTQPLQLTLRYALPQAVGSGGGGGGGGGSGGSNKTMNSVTIDTPTLNAGITAANGFIGKRIDMSHTILVVFSKELAEKGISEYIYGIARGKQYRPSLYIAISRTTAKEYLDSINPVQELDPSKYIQLLYSAYHYTGYTSNTQFFNFYTSMTSLGVQPTAVLAGVGKYKSPEDFKSKYSTPMTKKQVVATEGSLKAGEIPKTGDVAGEIMGLAVFNGDKMVGELNGDEARSHLMVTGNFRMSYLNISDPLVPDTFVLMRLAQSRKPKSKVDFSAGRPKISVEIKLEGDFISIQSGKNYENPDNVSIIQDAVSNLLSKDITTFLEKTAGHFNSDICGFGKTVRKNFLIYNDWEAFKWLDKYKYSTFDVSVDVKIRRPGLIIKSAPVIRSESEGKK